MRKKKKRKRNDFDKSNRYYKLKAIWVPTRSKDTRRTLIVVSRYLEIEFWPEAINFAYGDIKIGKSGWTGWFQWHALWENSKEFKDSK